VIAFAALSGPLPKLGVILAAMLAAAVVLAREDSPRAWAMLGALLLAPGLLLDEIWNSPQLHIVHRHPLEGAVAAALVVAAVVALAVAIARRPRLLGPLAMLALPFRVPVSVGGQTSNLLVPLYLVIGAACLGWLVPAIRADRAGAGPAFAGPGEDVVRGSVPLRFARFEQLLAGFLVLYAVQAIYSADFDKALQNMAFFYVPFALLFARLRALEWDRDLLTRCLQVTVALAIVFACIGFVEEDTKKLLLNPKLIATNNLHTYFTVNSVFFDPDIFGRYLAIVMIMLVAVLLHEQRRRQTLALSAILAILWGGLVVTLSRSSLAALVLGMATLAAFRWRVSRVLIAGAVVVGLGAGALALSPKTFGLNEGLNNASSGRANLISGGLDMFGDRPLQGYGSGSFEAEYQAQHPGSCTQVCASHTIPITIAAEQGVIGLIAYFALVIAAVAMLWRGARGDPQRVAIAAAFLALLLHTMLYADFLEDPITWTLLGIGAALASQSATRLDAVRRNSRRRGRAPAHA
jgi:O-antigen ligase